MMKDVGSILEDVGNSGKHPYSMLTWATSVTVMTKNAGSDLSVLLFSPLYQAPGTVATSAVFWHDAAGHRTTSMPLCRGAALSTISRRQIVVLVLCGELSSNNTSSYNYWCTFFCNVPSESDFEQFCLNMGRNSVNGFD